MIDLATAKAMGICPNCEGYGGGDAPEGHENSKCLGVCPECWHPGCHDGHDFPGSRLAELDDGDPCGSWLAYRLVEREKEKERRRKAEARSPQMALGAVLEAA